jgi:hypothetical protein
MPLPAPMPIALDRKVPDFTAATGGEAPNRRARIPFDPSAATAH